MMECKSVVDSGGGSSSSSSGSSVQECVSSVCEDEEAGWLTSTPQLPRRPPLHHITTASPRPPPPQHTPYRYHGCKSIPEEREDQENIDPGSKVIHDSTYSNAKCSTNGNGNGVSPGSTSHTSSSPFAYPLIWEGSRTSVTTPTTASPTDIKTSRPPSDCMAWRSPISHRDQHRPSAKEEHQERREESREGSVKVGSRSGSGNEGVKGVSHAPSVTPSKATHSHVLTNSSVFLTPSSSMHSRPGENRGVQTPKQQHSAPLSSSTVTNPFEVGAESLYVSAVSPSLFQQVVSPSQKVDVNFRWSIDQMAALQPVNIETSPFTQMEGFVDPDYERRAQDAIDRFFTSHQSVIPSPWTGSNKSISVIKKMCVQQSQASPSLPPVRTQSVWSQTELSLPPVLPPALEEALKPFCTFTQNQGWQGSGEGDEANNLNNTTLRRKLLFPHEDQPSSTMSPRKADDDDDDDDDDCGGDVVVEDSGLVWCTAVVGMSDERERGGASIIRHSPPTPPTTTTTTTTPPPPHATTSQPLPSPNVSPIHNHNHHIEDSHGNNTFMSSDVLGTSVFPHLSNQGSGSPHNVECGGQFTEEVNSNQAQEEEEEDICNNDLKPLNSWSQTPDKEMKPLSSTSDSPATQLRTSSNSGHFSSSPIRDLCHSPLEVDSPAGRFSASPPLSPILYRSLMFRSQPHNPPQPVLHAKERRQIMELNRNERSDIGVVSTTTTTTTTTTTQPHSSSFCDMEMDSQPSVESNLGEEMSYQDTGYHTVNSLSSNYSCLTYGQDLTHLLPQLDPTTTTTTTTKHPPSTHLNRELRP